jgi:threonine dehydrogenase-like Zn-dependent dehydrogenase
MRALCVEPRRADSAKLHEVRDAGAPPGWLLVETLAIGICGTDREIAAGEYGAAPLGETELVLGHESVGRVVHAPAGGEFTQGDLVAAIVRRPDPVPCANCAAGEWDMCRNGRYREHGIKELHGFCRDRFALEPEFAVPIAPELGTLGVLIETASIVAKAWEHVAFIGRRAAAPPRAALITGAGPVGLLAALMGKQRGMEVRVLDRVRDGPKPELVASLGAAYHSKGIEEAADGVDVVLECTGSASLVIAALGRTARAGIVCLTGLSTGERTIEIDVALLNRRMVLENDVVFGCVNANRRHYLAAAEALERADRSWLARLVTRRVPVARFGEALEAGPHDVKTVIDFTL